MTAFARSAHLALVVLAAAGAVRADPPPRFTEEREAAARHFIRKQCPDVIPLLDDLKKANRAAYELQIRETFQVTELLAELEDDPKRYDLELKMWKAENQALVLVAKLTTPKDDDRKAIESQLQALARELVELELQSLEHRIDLLQSELASSREERGKLRENFDRSAKNRFEALLEKARKKKP